MGKSFSITLFSMLVNMLVDLHLTFKKLEETMQVHIRHFSQASTYDFVF